MPLHWGFWKLLGPQTCWQSLLLPSIGVLKSKRVQAQDTLIWKESPNKGPFEAGSWALAWAQSSVGLERSPGTCWGEEGLWDGGRKDKLSSYSEFISKPSRVGFQNLLSFLCQLNQHAYKMWAEHYMSEQKRELTHKSTHRRNLFQRGCLTWRPVVFFQDPEQLHSGIHLYTHLIMQHFLVTCYMPGPCS